MMSLARGLHRRLSFALSQSAPLPATSARRLCPLPFRLQIQDRYNTMVKPKKVDAFFKRKTSDKDNCRWSQYFGQNPPLLKVIKVMKPAIKKITIINHILGWLLRGKLVSCDWGDWDLFLKFIMCMFLCPAGLALILNVLVPFMRVADVH